jgi:crotonobetainyl-CoA:carnitine CoA-transferase CaiB-like acyl-CoA transferase
MTTPHPLSGIRVLELTTAVAGPIAGCVFADMGAEVIKIEAPLARTAAAAASPPPIEGAPDHPYNRIPFYNELHRGKRHVSLDLANPEGRTLFLQLVAKSDVVIENFSPRVLGNLHIDYPDLCGVKPDIILASMPAFGKTGPYADRRSYGPGVDAMSGLSHLTGYPDRAPGKPAQFYLDQSAGLTAALTVMSALRHRRRTGEGQYIELAMLEGELQLVAPALQDFTMNGRVQMRIGNRHAWHAPQGVYPSAGDDQWIAIAIETDDQWRALATTLGHPELAEDLRYATEPARHANQDTIDPLIAAWTATRTHYDAMHELQRAGVSAGAVLDAPEVETDPQFLHRETLTSVDHPEMGRFPHTRTAWLSRRGHHGVSGPAPIFAEANNYVLRDILDIDEPTAAALHASGVLAAEPHGGS